MDFQQSHRYMRPPPPPPPSMADPHHQLPPRHPLPQTGPWFSGQFQYQHSPSPPPPHQQQWPPPPHSDHLPPPPYPAPPPHPPYPPSRSLPTQYPPPPLPHRPNVPPPYPHAQIPQSYSQLNQDWSNPSWGHHQGWEYPAHSNEEDWAAKARAWAAAKAATDGQHPQPQFTPVSRLEEQNHYHDQFLPAVDPHYPDFQQSSLPASNYQQYLAPAAPPHRTSVVHPQESASFSSVQSSYLPDGHLPYASREGTLPGESNVAFPLQENSPTIPLVHQQEVPSSYSSVAGKEEAGDQRNKSYKSLPLPIGSTPQHHVQPLMHPPRYAFGNQSTEPIADLSDQPLDFAPRFSHDHDPHMQPNYNHFDSGESIRGVDPVAAMPPIQAWTPPAAPCVVYPPIPSVLPSGPQVDPSVAAPSPVPAQSTPLFGRMAGQSFQPTIPLVGAPFAAGTGTALTAFPADAYGVSERPKKASVPNWLREEIIKKAVIASSAPELPIEETQSIDDDGVDKSLGKGDQADSKSIDSSRSTEEDDDDEDYVEAARTAAVNQEIKRVLTEVLLKVTDELFDEIATKVLSEDELPIEVGHNIAAPNNSTLPSTPAVPTPKASAKVLIPTKAKETDSDDASGKSNSSSPGDVLGLASYASDDDETNKIQSSGLSNSKENSLDQHPTIGKLSGDINVFENGSSQADTEERNGSRTNVESDPHRMSPNGATVNHRGVVSELRDDRGRRESEYGNIRSRYSSKTEGAVAKDDTDIEGEKVPDSFDASKSKDRLGVEDINAKKSTTDDSHSMETRNKPDRNDKRETKRSPAGTEFVKEVEGGEDRTYDKGDENLKMQDERHLRKERPGDRNGTKERMKAQGVKSGERAKDSDSRKRSSHHDFKEDRKETEKNRRAIAKEDNDRKRERTKDEKGERFRHKVASESSRHKRRRSSSVGSRIRNSKDNSVISHANDSSNESSDDSKRKLHSKRHNLSPSPVRSRRRQVSRSPHSRHSQRRHSPYSSLETTRGRNSRSRSPAHRHR